MHFKNSKNRLPLMNKNGLRNPKNTPRHATEFIDESFMLYFTLNIKLLVLYHFNSKKILHLKINMNATFSKKDSKNLDEIQATRMLMF
jgi:hypothetical protein